MIFKEKIYLVVSVTNRGRIGTFNSFVKKIGLLDGVIGVSKTNFRVDFEDNRSFIFLTRDEFKLYWEYVNGVSTISDYDFEKNIVPELLEEADDEDFDEEGK